MNFTTTTTTTMRIHKNNKEKESSQLAQSLSQFGNVKNEFIVSGRIASKNLIQERRFDEAVRVCEMVLAVDPDDIETCDLKERAIVYFNNPDQFDLHEMQKMMDKTGNGSSSPQRLLRSASERRVRRTDGGAIIMSTIIGNSNLSASDKNNNGTTTTTGTGTNGENNHNNSEQTIKLRRTRSELHRPNVLQRIKEFEKQAQHRSAGAPPSTRSSPDSKEISETSTNIIETTRETSSTTTTTTTVPDILPKVSNHTAVFKTFDPRRNSPPAPTPAQPESQNFINTSIISSSDSISPTTVRLPRKAGLFLPYNTIIKSNVVENSTSSKPSSSAVGFSFPKVKTEILTPVSEDEVCQSKVERTLLLQNGKPTINWTEIGKNVSEVLRSQLDINCFTSSLIKKACIINTNSEVLASFGWNHLKKHEFNTLIQGMSNQTYLTSSKLRLDGIELNCMSGTGTVVRARFKKMGVNCTKLNNNFLVIVMYEHPVLPKEVAMLVRRFGEIITKNTT